MTTFRRKVHIPLQSLGAGCRLAHFNVHIMKSYWSNGRSVKLSMKVVKHCVQDAVYGPTHQFRRCIKADVGILKRSCEETGSQPSLLMRHNYLACSLDIRLSAL